MAVCCETGNSVPVQTTGLIVALAGNPNSGKTTIFNALTGLRQKVGNYPGITVERKIGRCRLPAGNDALIVDLPGTYSLISRSPDEVVAMEVLRGLRDDTQKPDAVIVVVDASNLQRNLYLVSQIIELGCPMVIALNMMDVAQRRGIEVLPEQLSKELGVPVVPVVGHKREGIDELKAAIAHARVALMPDWPLPEAMKEELTVVGGGLAILDSDQTLECPSTGLSKADKQHLTPQLRLDRYRAIAERLLVGDRAGDLTRISATEPVVSMLQHASSRMEQVGIDPMQADVEAHYRWIESVAGRATRNLDEAPSAHATQEHLRTPRHEQLTLSERVDAILVHRFWGLLIFAAIMGSLFVSIFWLADPIMGALQSFVGWIGVLVTGNMADGPFKALLNDGIFAGVGSVVVFLPQIALLFLFLSMLEDSGYLARAAFLMDRLLWRVGLHGKSFIPLLSSFACAIPGVLSTRTIENPKDRLATIMVAPFMSCSARLPVYTLLISAFFADHSPWFRAGMMLSLYALGMVAAAGTAWLFNHSFLQGPTPAFILEFPSYKLPQVSQIARQVLTNCWEFVRRAGTIIFSLSVLLWAIAYYPQLPEAKVNELTTAALAQGATREAAQASVQSAQLENSIAGHIGHLIEPAIRPLGYDWKIGVGLIASFAAREVFVSTMAVTYATGDEGGGLEQAMRSDVYSPRYGQLAGSPVWTPLIGVSVLVWFVLAMQCISTLAVVKRETGSWKWPLIMLAYMNALAYIVCLLIYQIGTRLA